MRSTVGFFTLATLLFAMSITLASRPLATVKHHPANPSSELWTESNSAARASYSSSPTGFVSSTQTSSATAPLPGGQIYFNSDRDGNSEIYAVNADGSEQTRLTNNLAVDADPIWSSSSQKIAFVTNRDSNFEIYTMNAFGGNQTRLTFNAGSDGSPVWSPNGQKIAFTTDRDGNYEIYTMNSDGSGQTRLTFNSSNDMNPTWSPDGSQISFQSNRDGNVEIYAIYADGNGGTRLTNNSADDSFPDWSPDGTRILFTSTRDGNQEIYVMNADGSNQTRLTSQPDSDGLPVWSPDGKTVAFETNRDGNFEIYTMNADGSQQTRLTTNAATDENPSWGPLTYSISGHVTRDGVAETGVTIALSGSLLKNVITDENGNYSLTKLPAGGNYSIQPTKLNYTFGPLNLSFSNLSSDQTGVNFVVTQVRYSISGHISSGGTPLNGVGVTLSGSQTNSTFTDANGNYAFNFLAGSGNYTVTPSKLNFSFSPASLSFNGLSTNQTSANFEATRTGLSIGALVYRPGVGAMIGLGNVPVTISGPTSATAFTDSSGVVYFDNLQSGGTYTLTAVPQPGFKLLPTSQVFTNVTSDLFTFFQSLPIYNVSGRVTDGRGNGVADVTMVLGIQGDPPPSGPLTTTTDANGSYTFGDLTPADINFSYLVTFAVYPKKAGQTFAPILYRTVAGVDISGISVGVFFRNTPKTVSGINFTLTKSISGRVFDSNGPVSGVTLRLSGQASAVATSDSNGNYSFSSLGAGNNYTITPTKTGLSFAPPSRSIASLGANQTDVNFAAQPFHAGFEPVVLDSSQVEIKTWTAQGKTYAYVKLLFPDGGYGVTNWGQVVKSGNDFATDATIERSTGQSVQALTTTAQIYDLGTLADGSYTFTFRNYGFLAKSSPFTVSSAVPPPNPIDNAREFVRQQYRDFLNREADQAGEDFWTDNITKCSDPARRPAGQTVEQCTLRQRETTSAAFFLSPEFRYTGYYVYRMYVGALGRPPKLSEFVRDVQFVANGILVNGQLSATVINQNKAAFAAEFQNCTDATKYRCAEFKARYDSLNNTQYVDKLFETTGVNATANDRVDLVNSIGANTTRAGVLQKVVDGVNVISEGNQQFTTTYGQAFYNAELNRAFVQLEYFGYMRRDPDEAGFALWFAKLNQFGGDFVAAEMVLAFINSPEYRARFGQP